MIFWARKVMVREVINTGVWEAIKIGGREVIKTGVREVMPKPLPSSLLHSSYMSSLV
jgi:hypothetical protein